MDLGSIISSGDETALVANGVIRSDDYADLRILSGLDPTTDIRELDYGYIGQDNLGVWSLVPVELLMQELWARDPYAASTMEMFRVTTIHQVSPEDYLTKCNYHLALWSALMVSKSRLVAEINRHQDGGSSA